MKTVLYNFYNLLYFIVAAREGVLKHTWTELTDDEILLRKWDMNMAYGPCTGLSRYTSIYLICV